MTSCKRRRQRQPMDLVQFLITDGKGYRDYVNPEHIPKQDNYLALQCRLGHMEVDGKRPVDMNIGTPLYHYDNLRRKYEGTEEIYKLDTIEKIDLVVKTVNEYELRLSTANVHTRMAEDRARPRTYPSYTGGF